MCSSVHLVTVEQTRSLGGAASKDIKYSEIKAGERGFGEFEDINNDFWKQRVTADIWIFGKFSFLLSVRLEVQQYSHNCVWKTKPQQKSQLS